MGGRRIREVKRNARTFNSKFVDTVFHEDMILHISKNTSNNV